MAHTSTRKGLFLLTAAGLLSPLGAARTIPTAAIAAVQTESRLEFARIDVTKGRAVFLGGGQDASTLRRGESVDAHGRAQLEISAGSQARIGWTGTMSVVVYGPSSVEWSVDSETVRLVFHELSWADVEIRSGVHSLSLPADWHAEAHRGSLHLRGLSGGPSELRCNAGVPVALEWLGDRSELRPPVIVYPGSSVRLDAPRFVRREAPDPVGRLSSWDTPMTPGEDLRAWPYRRPAETPKEMRVREVLSRETQQLTEVPGSPNGQIGRIRTFELDGSSTVRPLRRSRDRSGSTYAQIPVTPRAPRIEIETRPFAGTFQPAAPSSPRELPKPAIELPRREDSTPDALGSRPHQPRADTSLRALETRDDSSRESTRVPETPTTEPGAAPASSAKRDGARFPYERSQWRGLLRSSLNGVDEIAAERGSGVEVRVLGEGRTKVFVSSGSPSPRWCFSPTVDYLLKPGAVAMFDADGSLRMSMGEIEKHAPIQGRPSYSRLEVE